MFNAMLLTGGLLIPDNVIVPLSNRYLAITASQVAVSKGFGAVSLGAFQTLIDRASYIPSASANYLIHLTSHQGFIYGIYYDGGINPSVKKLDSSGTVLATSIAFDFASPPDVYNINPLISDGTYLYAFGYSRLTRFNSDLTVSSAMKDIQYVPYYTAVDSSYYYVSSGAGGGRLLKFSIATFLAAGAGASLDPLQNATIGAGALTQNSTYLWLNNTATQISKIDKSNVLSVVSTLTIPSRVQSAPIRYFLSINALAVCFPAEDKIRFYDATTHAFKYEFTVGDNPWEFDMDAEGNVWVANQGSEFVSIIPANSLT